MADYSDSDWGDLPEDVKAAATSIGYTEEIWAADGNTPLSDTAWTALTDEQRAAAEKLGYDEASWTDDE
eukprot:CAMPEP_0198249046 /NCGR_PEP_ID=MMETSP1447-20131203/668_1 /TAXON_ID=420782 /ORGANISM="Chaetoceros dichaeta, Strain CCMP1751" /LENGTH=68 /DNA_ID=CAMNT_0043933579 /DNA_START=52 /DNA_END=258 /DNA_ORIENTATION=+